MVNCRWYTELENEQNALNISKGSGVLVNLPTKRTTGSDLLTLAEHGRHSAELDWPDGKRRTLVVTTIAEETRRNRPERTARV